MKNILALSLLISSVLYAQGPAGVSSNLLLWLSSDAGVYQDAGTTISASGDPVQEWHDQSANGHVLQGTGSARPTLGADGVDFDGTDDMLSLTGGLFDGSTAYSELEVFIVKITDEIKDESIFYQSLSPSHVSACFPCLANEFAYFEAGDGSIANGAILAPWGGTIGTKYIWGMTTDNNNFDDTPKGKTITRDGLAIPSAGTATATTVVGSANDFTVGNISTGGSRYVNGKIAEIVIYSRLLNTAERTSVVDYLSAKHQVATATSVTFDGTYSGGSGGSNAPNTSDDTKSFLVSSGNATLSANATVASFSIADGATLTLAPNVTLTVNGESFISGAEALVLQSDASGTANFIDNGVSYKNSGTIKVERFMPFSSAVFLEGYHYIGSPINNHAKFTDASDLYYYDETTLSWIHHSSFTNFTNGVGYAIRYTSETTKDFIGSINTGNITVPITFTDNGASSFDHFNLVSNPYSSSISADGIVDNNSGILNPTLYFWNGEDYATYNTTLNAGTAGSMGGAPTTQIAVGQGFYVDAKAAGTLTMTNTMRGNDSDTFFKEESFPQFRVVLSGKNGRSDLLLTGHAASSFAADDYDTKHLPANSRLSLTSTINGKPFDIQSVPQIDAIPFDLQVIASTADEFSFTLKDTKGLTGMHIYLEDRENGLLTDISEATYHAYIPEGTHTDRFKLRVSKEVSAFAAWVNNGLVEVFSEEIKIQSVRLIALDGKVMATTNNMRFNNWNQLANGVYLLEINTDQNKFVQKIVK